MSTPRSAAAGALSVAARRLLRALVPPRSTLRRSSDRAEVAARWVALLVALLVVPVSLTVGSEVSARMTAAALSEQAESRPVRTVVVEAPKTVLAPGPAAGLGHVWTHVVWTGADGAPRTGLGLVSPLAGAGTPVDMWVDRQERIVPRPLSPGAAAANGPLSVLGIMAAYALLAALVLAGLRWVLDRRRLREWDDAWRRFMLPGAGSVR